MTNVHVAGTTNETFAPVVEAFEQNFSAHSEVGAAFAVTLENELVVDIWGGWTDADCARPWVEDTIVNCFSVTKGVTSLLFHLLVDRGTIGLDERVSEYWPEYARQGKEDTLVRDVLGHLAGLPWLHGRIGRRDLFDWDRFCRRLEAAAPIFPPSTRPVYHALTFGHLAGEIIQRATGRPFRDVLVEELTAPTDADFHIGLDAQHFERVSDLFGPSPLGGMSTPLMGTQVPTVGVGGQQSRLVELAKTSELRAAVIPSVNGHGNARSVAALYAHAANPGGLMSHQAVTAMGERQFGRGDWGAIRGGRAAAWACGFMPNWTTKYGPNAAAFGHDGFGGSFGACDPGSHVSLAYVVNHLSDESGWDDRGASVVRSFYECLSNRAQ